MDNLEWSAPEYMEKEHSQDWFWALGVIVVCGSIASMIYRDYFFAGLLVLGGILLGFFAIKKPEMVEYELSNRGLRIDKRVFPYDSLKSFYVRLHPEPTLLIHSQRFFMPVIAIPLGEEFAEEVREVMLAHNVPEEKLTEHSTEKIMDSLGF